MSTIGTTLKQPRIFAHDAIALDGLPDTLTGEIATITAPILPVVGSFYVAGLCNTTGGNGYGATVTITVDGSDQIDGIALTAGGEHYEIGDTLTIVQPGSTNEVQFVIASLSAATVWALGDPITPMPRLASNPPVNGYNPIPYWNEKTSYTYTSTLGGPHQTPGPGAAIYMGVGGSITVINESTTEVTYTGVAAGSFLPVSVLSVVALADGPTTADVLALF